MKLDDLNEAVAGNAAAIRRNLRLQPAGGKGSKVFPPTLSGGVYAWEQRRIDGAIVPTVLLDSVPSQANRMEEALMEAYRDGKIKFPLLQVDLSKHPDIGTITALELPHRIADATLRESSVGGKKFRDSYLGQALTAFALRNASEVLQYCPTALIFGFWDSAISEGGSGNKVQRSISSEINAFYVEKGVRTASRLDPLFKTQSNPEIYQKVGGGWTANPEEAEKDDKTKKPKKYKRLSEMNIGNIPPDLVRYNPKEDKKPLRTMYEEIRVGDVLPGGVTFEYALQTTVLSLPALRRLKFPVNGTDSPPSTNNAARTVLAALALAAICHMDAQGYDLRSRCQLVPEEHKPFELVANDGTVSEFELNVATADKIFAEAVEKAKQLGLPWHDEPITLTPSVDFANLIKKSRESGGGEE